MQCALRSNGPWALLILVCFLFFFCLSPPATPLPLWLVLVAHNLYIATRAHPPLPSVLSYPKRAQAQLSVRVCSCPSLSVRDYYLCQDPSVSLRRPFSFGLSIFLSPFIHAVRPFPTICTSSRVPFPFSFSRSISPRPLLLLCSVLMCCRLLLTFWLRRWMEHSRSLRWITLPWPSART